MSAYTLLHILVGVGGEFTCRECLHVTSSPCQLAADVVMSNGVIMRCAKVFEQYLHTAAVAQA